MLQIVDEHSSSIILENMTLTGIHVMTLEDQFVIIVCQRYVLWYYRHNTVSKKCDMSVVFSSTNKTDRHDRTEILLKVALNTIKQTIKQIVIS